MNKILSGFNKIFPKRKLIVFNSFPDVSGNALALYEYILKNRTDIIENYKLVWTVRDKSVEEARKILEIRTGNSFKHNIIKKKRLYGFLCYFSAKYVVSTHGYFPMIETAPNQTHINLWHGMPFKRIGRLLEGPRTNGRQDEADSSIATSETFRNLMAKAFGISTENVYVTGQPCNDLLFKDNLALANLNINKKDYSKIILWMPTYRNSTFGDIRKDGNAESFGVREVLLNEFDNLEKILTKNNYLLLIKPHPMDEICKINFRSSNHIRVISNEYLDSKNVLLYELLGNCDILLTDYSSVFIDFLITNKPIAFVCDDVSEYGDSRGFCFETPMDYMPGEIISNYTELIEYLENVDEFNSKWEKKYEEIKQLFNPLNDGKASERVCDVFWPKKI